MGYEVELEDVEARPLAAVRRRVPVGHVGEAWRPALDIVWDFLRRHEGLRTDGHNTFVYRHPVGRADVLDVDFGVEVSRRFEGEGEVVCTLTPAGRAASTLHAGPISRLADAYAAIEVWCSAHDHPHAGVSWEVYGDPGDDPARYEVRVSYLLA